MEQDRASPVRLHQPELARQAAVSYQAIVQLIAATTTRTGLNVKCEIDRASYPAGVKVTDAEMAAINITPHEFHGEFVSRRRVSVMLCER